MKINEVCHELNNYFERDLPKFHGAFEISGGKIVDADFVAAIKENQYFRIIGSIFNDGVWQNTAELELTDEAFVGTVWLMAIPKDFIDLVDEMNAWETAHGSDIASPFTSESFGGYSYSKGTKGSASGGMITSSLDMFASRLNKWRKLR